MQININNTINDTISITCQNEGNCLMMITSIDNREYCAIIDKSTLLNKPIINHWEKLIDIMKNPDDQHQVNYKFLDKSIEVHIHVEYKYVSDDYTFKFTNYNHMDKKNKTYSNIDLGCIPTWCECIYIGKNILVNKMEFPIYLLRDILDHLPNVKFAKINIYSEKDWLINIINESNIKTVVVDPVSYCFLNISNTITFTNIDMLIIKEEYNNKFRTVYNSENMYGMNTTKIMKNVGYENISDYFKSHFPNLKYCIYPQYKNTRSFIVEKYNKVLNVDSNEEIDIYVDTKDDMDILEFINKFLDIDYN